MFPNNVMLLTCTNKFALLHKSNLDTFTSQTKVSGSRSIKFKNKSTLYYILNKYLMEKVSAELPICKSCNTECNIRARV